MGPPTLNLVPPAPFPRPLASDADDLPDVIVDETDFPSDGPNGTDQQPHVEPLPAHPQGVDTGEPVAEPSTFSVADEGIVHDSLTLGDLRTYVRSAFKVKVSRPPINRVADWWRNRDNTRSRTRIPRLCRRK
jgi:hypothetical protein